MRDPDRNPIILAAVERRWREKSDLRLGQFLLGLSGDQDLGLIEDGALLDLLEPVTDEERRYIREEPNARRGAWREVVRQPNPLRRNRE